MIRYIWIIPMLLTITACAHEHHEIDFSETKEAINKYYNCSAVWTKKYSEVNNDPLEIAVASVSKCETFLLEYRNSIRNVADKEFEKGTAAWRRVMSSVETDSTNLKNKTIQKSIAYQLDIKLKKQNSKPETVESKENKNGNDTPTKTDY